MTIARNTHFPVSNFAVFLLFSAFLFQGCFVKKEIAKKKIIPDKNSETVFEELKKHELKFDWLSLKADAETNVDGKFNSFKITIRIRKDSLIWMMFSSPIGIEAARIVITPDSIKILDKINSAYYLESTDSLSEKFDVAADFQTLQSLLIGNSIDLKDTSEMKISVDKGDYLLSSMKKRKLRRAIEKNEKYEKKSEKFEKKKETAESERKSEKFEKKSEKFEKKSEKFDMVLQSLWVNATSFKITKISINDLKTNQTLIAGYENFLPVEEQLVPHFAKFNSLSGKEIKLKLEYSKVTLNVPQSVPFNIPEKYERK